MNLKRVFNICLLVAWMICIFLFSNQPADVSTKTSTGFTKTVVSVYSNISGKDVDDSTMEEIIDKTFVIVRKSGHIFEYLILGLLIVNVLKDYMVIDKKMVILSLIFCFLYACSDEIHQLFVPGRSGEFKDVLIDTFGSSIGIGSCYLIKRFKK